MQHYRVVLETVLKQVVIEEEFVVQAKNEKEARLVILAGAGYEVNQPKIIEYGDTISEKPTLIEKVDL